MTGVRYVQRAETREEVAAGRPAEARLETADAVVSRGAAHALRGLLPEEWRAHPPFAALERFGGSPIVSVEMWLDRVVVDRLMLGLRDSEMEWVFDKGRLYGREGAPQHLAFIVSAAYRSASKTNAELVAAAEGALRRYFPAMAGATVERALVLREPLATFASTPELEALRPGPGHADRGALPRGRLDGHRPARHDRGRRAQRAARRPARARVPPDARERLRQGRYSRRVTFGKVRQTGTPQKCSPSVQVGVMRPWRSTQGGPMWRARRGWTARTCSSSSIEAR